MGGPGAQRRDDRISRSTGSRPDSLSKPVPFKRKIDERRWEPQKRGKVRQRGSGPEPMWRSVFVELRGAGEVPLRGLIDGRSGRSLTRTVGVYWAGTV